jgi:hypothetical protein
VSNSDRQASSAEFPHPAFVYLEVPKESVS